ncbi:MAG: membrane protein insertase YidC [Oscillospiraceae bacterium]|nr:membrane protein insertase YidC [Oscillospiraceae bacterium]
MSFGEIVTWPFAKVMVFFYGLTHSYGLSLILFSFLVNLVLMPFMAKSKKSMMRTTRLQPRIQEIQRRHEGNQQKLNAEMQKLYQEEGVNPLGGCLWSLLPLFLLIPLYSIIRLPITRMMGASSSVVEALSERFSAELSGMGNRVAAYKEIILTNLAHANWESIDPELKSAGLLDVDLSFLGVPLGDTPDWRVIFTGPWTWAAIGLFLIPLLCTGLSWLSMKVANATNPSTAQQDAASKGMGKTMNLMMPLMSLFFCFMMPAAMGIYWMANSFFAMIRDYFLTKYYKKQLDIEDAERLAARSEREKELEAKREETERLKAEGKTEVNTNTSKKKLQANEKQQNAERRAAAEKAERAARRERLGIKEEEKPASQVGNRRYARGRAYVPDRYENPEAAEEATLAAAMESEGQDSIDYSVEDNSPANEQE